MSPKIDTRNTFCFLENSKFRTCRSEIQEACNDAINLEPRRNGIIISPCGSGKTAIALNAAMQAGAMVLIVGFESQGVLQIAKDLRMHTTLQDSHICVCTGKSRGVPGSNFCYMVTTYGTFSGVKGSKSEATKKAQNFVMNTKFDLVVLDEVHHACAPTYRPFIEHLVKNATRVLGFTATLFRNEYSYSTQTREEHEDEAFGWLGPVLFRRNCADLEKSGLIAKIRRAVVPLALTKEFEIAHAMAFGSQKTYIAALNAQKINAIKIICELHQQWNHAGIVFAGHLLVAKIYKAALGEGWEILSGSAAHGVEGHHSAEQNANIVERFNRGELKGMVCTAVGQSSLDATLENFCYIVVGDADGGVASAAQLLGRVARSPRITCLDGESDDELTQRRLKIQKQAAYYEIKTLNTEDETSSEKRKVMFRAEGYDTEIQLSYEDLKRRAATENIALPYTTLEKEMCLLKEVLQYAALGQVCTVASAAAAVVKKPQRDIIKHNKVKHGTATTKVMRQIYNHRENKARMAQPAVNVVARDVKKGIIKSARLPEPVCKIFRELHLPLQILTACNVVEDVLMAPSDDDDEE
tara:strand:+ start:710 stop:2455 length:1746 start_codon:yes stop_codon:yes gene_type:complete